MSPTTQCWNSWACLIGSWEGATGVFLSLLLMVYIPHLSHRDSPHHLPSSANCLTFQICLAPASESLRCEMVITRRERKPGAGTWTRAEWNLKFQQNLDWRLWPGLGPLMLDHKSWAKIMELLQISAIGEFRVYTFMNPVSHVRSNSFCRILFAVKILFFDSVDCSWELLAVMKGLSAVLRRLLMIKILSGIFWHFRWLLYY